MSASKRKGTGWESAIVQFLAANGVPHAERRALAGSSDKGDIAGIPGVAIEAKNCRTITLGQFVDEATVEAANAGARIGAAWIKRRGKASPGQGYVAMSGEMFLRLLVDAGYVAAPAADVECCPAYPNCHEPVPGPLVDTREPS